MVYLRDKGGRMTPDEKRLAIHFFDARGKSMLTRDHQEELINKLEAENLELRRLLKKASAALKVERAKSVITETLN